MHKIHVHTSSFPHQWFQHIAQQRNHLVHLKIWISISAFLIAVNDNLLYNKFSCVVCGPRRNFANCVYVLNAQIETIKDLQAAGTTSIGDVLPIVLDVGIIPIAAYFAYEDMKNRYENVERIWKEVKAKK